MVGFSLASFPPDLALTDHRYYWAANIGCLSALITVPVEKAVSFWLAYLIPLM
jgi:hypothetical protein